VSSGDRSVHREVGQDVELVDAALGSRVAEAVADRYHAQDVPAPVHHLLADLLAKEALADPGVMAEVLHHQDVRKAEGLTAGDLMTHPAVTAAPEDPVEQAARMMHFMRVKRLPVVNAGGQLVGIVSRSDVLATFDRPDEDIRRDIVDTMLRHEFLIDSRLFTVTVESGVVTMEGCPETAALGHALVRKARHVPGVVAVRDRLTYPDTSPMAAGPVL